MYMKNFTTFQSQIEYCILDDDINIYLAAIEDDLDKKTVDTIYDSKERKKLFWKTLCNCRTEEILSKLIKVFEEHNLWIYTFLTCEPNNKQELIQSWKVTENLLQHLRGHSRRLTFTKKEIDLLCEEEVISESSKIKLLQSYESRTVLNNVFEVCRYMTRKTPKWYTSLLYIMISGGADFPMTFHDDLVANEDVELTKENVEIYVKAFMDKNCRSGAEKIREKRKHELKEAAAKCRKLSIFFVEDDDEFQNDNDEESLFSDYGTEGELNEFDLDINEDTTSTELNLKDFQFELAETALEGKNTIIYAPTGAGKTVVTAYIVNDHLTKHPQGRVAFLVNRNPLVEQQCKVLSKYRSNKAETGLEETDTVALLAGGDSPLCALMPFSKVFVMTSEILNNALTVDDGNKIESICEFSLIIFDECHNCMKSHPYVNIMRHYFNSKMKLESNSSSGIRLPQIVGLTASPRTNKNNDLNKIKENLYRLCANLDCFIVSYVKRDTNREELKDFLKPAEQEIIKTGSRVNDTFEEKLLNLMTTCERKYLEMIDKNYFIIGPDRIPQNKFSEEYIGFVGKLHQLNTKTKDVDHARQSIYSIYVHLNAYYRALYVNQMFDKEFALITIGAYLNRDGVNFTCAYDELFYEEFQDAMISTENVDQKQNTNPIIQEISKIIEQQLNVCDSSRILIFVKEIQYAYYLAALLKDSFNFEAAAIVGSNSSKKEGKNMTESTMKNLLSEFKNGALRVIVATTVLEEGLDVAMCNMVISFGVVTNETAMIQRMGRARSQTSRYILMLPPMLAWMERKELINENRRKKMMSTIEKFDSEDKRVQVQCIKAFQKEKFYKPVQKKVTKVESEGDWTFLCKNCQTRLCLASSIRIIEKMHRVVLDVDILTEAFKKKAVMKEDRIGHGKSGTYETAGSVLCLNCKNHKIGGYIFYKDVPFFQIKIDACTIRNQKGELKSCKKWKEFDKLYSLGHLDLLTEFMDYSSQVMSEVDLE